MIRSSLLGYYQEQKGATNVNADGVRRVFNEIVNVVLPPSQHDCGTIEEKVFILDITCVSVSVSYVTLRILLLVRKDGRLRASSNLLHTEIT